MPAIKLNREVRAAIIVEIMTPIFEALPIKPVLEAIAAAADSRERELCQPILGRTTPDKFRETVRAISQAFGRNQPWIGEDQTYVFKGAGRPANIHDDSRYPISIGWNVDGDALRTYVQNDHAVKAATEYYQREAETYRAAHAELNGVLLASKTVEDFYRLWPRAKNLEIKALSGITPTGFLPIVRTVNLNKLVPAGK